MPYGVRVQVSPGALSDELSSSALTELAETWSQLAQSSLDCGGPNMRHPCSCLGTARNGGSMDLSVLSTLVRDSAVDSMGDEG